MAEAAGSGRQALCSALSPDAERHDARGCPHEGESRDGHTKCVPPYLQRKIYRVMAAPVRLSEQSIEFISDDIDFLSEVFGVRSRCFIISTV